MSAGSGAKASTGVQAMMRQLIAKGADHGKEGIEKLTGAKVFKDKSNTQARDIKDVLVDVIGGAQGDMGKLQKIFGEEGMVGASKFIETFNQASNALGKGATEAEKRAAGERALRQLIDQNVNAGGDWNGVMQDATTAGDTFSAKMTTLSETILTKVGNALSPAIAAFAKHIDLIVSPLNTAAKAISLFSHGLSDITDFLVAAGVVTPKGESTLRGEEALSKMSQNDARLAELSDKEKRFGGLTVDQGYEKSELIQENLGLLQNVGRGPEREYESYQKALGTMIGPDGKPLNAAPMGFDQFVRQSSDYKNAQAGPAPMADDQGRYGRALLPGFSEISSHFGIAGSTAMLAAGAGLDTTSSSGNAMDKAKAGMEGAATKQQQASAQFLAGVEKMHGILAAMAKLGPPGATGAP
jgi:hypothetical protein